MTACGSAGAVQRVDTLDARTIEGEVRSIGENSVTVVVEGEARDIPLSDVATVSLAEANADAMRRAGQAVLRTTAGGLLPAERLNVAEGTIRLRNRLLGRVEAEIEAGREILLPPAAGTPAGLRAECLEIMPRERTRDVLVVRRDDGTLVAVQGALQAMDDDSVTFRWREADRRTSRKKVAAVFFADTGAAKLPAGRITGTDGSVAGFESLTMDGRAAKVELSTGGRASIPRERIASVRFLSDRVTPLTELEPKSVTERGYFDTVFPHRVGRSVGGGPIKLGGRTYADGLGLHSYCEMTWALDGRYETFAAVAGIDDAVRPRGAAALTFLVDGKPAGEPLRLTGKDDPQPVRVELDGAKTFTIRVGFGPDELDVSDHVDIADPRLIRAADTDGSE